jgi:collagenase-like PrtC family protease
MQERSIQQPAEIRKPEIRKPEIMSPAGYWPQLRAAIEAGADAVYFGSEAFFGAREGRIFSRRTA